jgi:hypothetical protein
MILFINIKFAYNCERRQSDETTSCRILEMPVIHSDIMIESREVFFVGGFVKVVRTECSTL